MLSLRLYSSAFIAESFSFSFFEEDREPEL
jgi:hypothetical protein